MLWIRLALLTSFLVAELGATFIEGQVELPPEPPARKVKARYTGPQAVNPADPSPPVAVVYLEGALKDRKPPQTPAPSMSQTGLQFFPALLPIFQGTEVAFPNEDPVYHNVFSYSSGHRFDLGRYRKGETPPTVRFDEPGVVRIFCEIHGHMRGTILVLDTPCFTVTDAEGNFRLDDIPAGDYMLVAWISESQQYRMPVTVTADEPLHLSLPQDLP